MLSTIWNQLANADSDSSEDESFPSRSTPMQEDDIAAASLLTTFPSYGSQRKMASLDSSSSNNNPLGPPNVSPLVPGDWEFSSPRRVRKNEPGGGLQGYEDDLDSTSHSQSTALSFERKRNTSPSEDRQGDMVMWSKDESEIWNDSDRTKSKKSGHHRRNKSADSMYFNAELRRQWIQGKITNSNGGMHGTPASRHDGSKEKEANRRLYRRQHFTFDDDVTINTEGSTSSDEERSTAPRGEKSNLLKDHLDGKSHWMPDVLCKKCYACDAQFTVFRRRHHCRLCGQVFCSRCSSCFVEIVGGRVHQNINQSEEQLQQTDVRTIRTCKVCYELVSSTGPNGFSFYNSNGGQGGDRIEGIVEDSKDTHGSTRSFSKIEEDRGARSSQVTGFQGGSSSDFFNLALVKEKLEEDRIRREKEERSDIPEDTKVPSPNPIKSITRRFGRLAESAAREAQLGDTGYNDEETKLIGTGVRNVADDGGIFSPMQNDQSESKKIKNDPFASIVGQSSGVSSADEKKRFAEKKAKEDRRLRLTAADYLEKMGRELMRSDAPTLLKELNIKDGSGRIFDKWVSKLMMLASKACSTVKVDIRNGDALDIIPYCKVKVIPLGSLKDSVYISGVVFHKNVSHKSMAREIENPRIMLLSGGIDYTRTEHKIASLNTLLEQEAKYLQILVAKISKIKPDILIVGRSVSRRAQELLLETNIVLIQHVKQSLMDRIARQTGATVLSSTDHVMNQFGTSVLGRCRRFRLVSFRDNDVWSSKCGVPDPDNDIQKIQNMFGNINDAKEVRSLLSTADIPNHQRQLLLAASLLGEKPHDGGKAVKRGMMKRGVAQTYVIIEGCPGHLGCTVVLRGASRAALKEVKRIFKFLVNVAYNLKLETSFFTYRHAMLPADYKLPDQTPMSSSLCVDYGQPPQGRKTVRPWNGGNSDRSQRSLSGKITALEHQSILISSVWMAGKTQCCPAEVKGICYYSQQDVSLGMFLRDSCFDLTLKCQNTNCKKSVLEHNLSFVHNDGLINITVEEMDSPIPPAERSQDPECFGAREHDKDRIATWNYCMFCRKVVTPLTYIDEDTYNYSFGKFLEVSFYNTTCIMNSKECQCEIQNRSILYFGCGNLAARFTYERIRPYDVFLRRHLPFDENYHKKFTVLELNEIMVSSTDLFERFDKHIETKSQETQELFVSAVNRAENLQMVLSELNAINKEVVYASGVLKNKIVSVTNRYNTFNQDAESGYSHGELGYSANDAFTQFPWYARRYLFMLTSAWNERLSVIGQAISSMKKVVIISQKLSIGSRSDIGIPQGVGADGELDEVSEAMQRLKEVREIYSEFNINNMDIHQSNFGGLPDKRKLEENDDIEDEDFNMPDSADGDDIVINFSEEVDADVLASRRRQSAKQTDSSSSRSLRRQSLDEENQRQRHKKKPPRRRSKERAAPYSSQVTSRDSFQSSVSSRSPSPSSQQKAKAVSAGGAVKSAINRFFNRGGKEDNLHTVDLGIFSEGRPKLDPGVGGVVIPVFDGQPSTIIAHSLASTDYESQFRRHTRAYLKENGLNRRGSSASATDSVAEDMKVKKYDSRSSRRGRSEYRRNATGTSSSTAKLTNDKADLEKRMLVRNKTHIKHAFRDYDEKGSQIAKFVCTTFWSTQFQAVRQAFLKEGSSAKPGSGSTYGKNIVEKNFVRSLSASQLFNAVGGKSGAAFSKTADDRFIVKTISRTELQMFLDCAPAYFEYLSKAFFHGLPTMLCKIVGVNQIGYHNRETGKRSMEQVAVMQNIFYNRNVSKIFDLKGSLKGRFAKLLKSQNKEKSGSRSAPRRKSSMYDSDASSDEEGDQSFPEPGFHDDEGGKEGSSTLLDGDFLEFTGGRPLPLTDRAKAAFHMSILNDTLFLSMINVLDYSILVGIDEDKNELVVGIIDFMRQYDILKQMERVGKSIPMVVGSEAPTIIQPPLYKARFITAMERYFMTVPSKWTVI